MERMKMFLKQTNSLPVTYAIPADSILSHLLEHFTFENTELDFTGPYHMASTQLTQLLNAVKARTEWLDLLTLKQLKELMHTGKFYELAV
ncbi:hypothetical protein T4E_11027 [Trichinella pseudospiralis]|uniref:Uncharacterized protein n=1 Tax=Trichinella pseudospiralis TaxID=6337 RepID=A0A0V0XFB0_TRIPS|nr:hypothetical protein T4E_11027 [Trichinella pseudospiralis]